MKKILTLGILATLMLAAAACSASLAGGDSGSIALVPFFNEEQGIQGVQPLEGWSDAAQLVQDVVPDTLDDLVAIVLEQTALSELPPPTGSYKGRAFTWELYTFDTQLQDTGSQTIHVDLALAEDDSAAYLVALAALPEAYEANPALYDAVFTHAVYALAPLD